VRARLLYRWTAANVQMTLAYRGSFLLLMLHTVMAPLVSLLIWLTVSEQGVPLPYDRSQFVTYYTLLGPTAMLTGTWIAFYVAERIRLGLLSRDLVRPAPAILEAIGNNLGEKVIKLILIAPLVGLMALLFWRDLRLPTDPLAWLLFLLSLPMAAFLAFMLDYAVGSLAFWVQDVMGLVRVKELLQAFLAGRFVPLALFPAELAPLLEAQPFRYTLSFPLELLTGALDTGALLRGFGWQLFYCLLLVGLHRGLWRLGLRGYEASGG
jgi:ABC-2 type transport system permease protein